MKRIKLAWILPLGQVLITVLLVVWARNHDHPPVRMDSPWAPTTEWLAEGISLPAIRLVEIALAVWSSVSTGVLGSGGRFFVNCMFLCGVGGLWFLVGRKLDAYRNVMPNVTTGRRRVSTVVWDVLIALYGLDLLIIICLHNVIFTNPRNGTGGDANFVGSLIYQILWFTWSLILFSFATLDLIRIASGTRSKTVDRVT